ncbi:hypothetical protein AB8O38_04605, partial [Saccharomonospora xinjiangensis]|uniref:hypothetical protein n=1 Tax=Saccharomonospora xinjiangensis TaxID=75294 RepID=UPI00350F0A35
TAIHRGDPEGGRPPFRGSAGADSLTTFVGLLAQQNPFLDWDVAERYSAGSHITEDGSIR